MAKKTRWEAPPTSGRIEPACAMSVSRAIGCGYEDVIAFLDGAEMDRELATRVARELIRHRQAWAIEARGRAVGRREADERAARERQREG